MFHNNVTEFFLVFLLCADMSWVVGDEDLIPGIYTSVRRCLWVSQLCTDVAPDFFVLILKFRTYLVRI